MRISWIRLLLTRGTQPRCSLCGAFMRSEEGPFDGGRIVCQACDPTIPTPETPVENRPTAPESCPTGGLPPRPPNAKAVCDLIDGTLVIRRRPTSLGWRVCKALLALWLFWWAFGCILCVRKLVLEPSLSVLAVTAGLIVIWLLVFAEFWRNSFGYEEFKLGPQGLAYRAPSLLLGDAERCSLARIASITHGEFDDGEGSFSTGVGVHTHSGGSMWIGVDASTEELAWLTATMVRHLNFLKSQIS